MRVVEVGETSDSALKQLDAAVHTARLEEQVLMQKTNAIEPEDRIRKVTEEAAAALDERVRLENSEGGKMHDWRFGRACARLPRTF